MVEREDTYIVEREEIELRINRYDDLFSDFDARPYITKALSVDFLDEIKRAALDKKEKIELRLLVPKQIRNARDEGVIRKRLIGHFKRHKAESQKELRKLLWKGGLFVFFGVICMLIATYLLLNLGESFFMHFVVILLEPGGWFLFWEGLDLLVFEYKKETPDFSFYEKMEKARVIFDSSK